jgi:hypothetical protein
MPFSTQEGRDGSAEMYADSSSGVGAKGQPVIGERAPGSGGPPPAVAPRDVRALHVAQLRAQTHNAEGGCQLPIFGECDAICRAMEAERDKNRNKPLIDGVTEESIRSGMLRDRSRSRRTVSAHVDSSHESRARPGRPSHTTRNDRVLSLHCWRWTRNDRSGSRRSVGSAGTEGASMFLRATASRASN